MKTVPEIPLEEHINGWLKTQQEYFPQLTEDMLVFCDEEDVVRTEIGESVEKKKLMKIEEFELFFEKLRDKFRFILDADNNIEFSRRRPFIPWDSNTAIQTVVFDSQ